MTMVRAPLRGEVEPRLSDEDKHVDRKTGWVVFVAHYCREKGLNYQHRTLDC